MTKTNISLVISIIAIILSIFAFCISESTFEGQNFLVGVLGILVTILLGWQIFNIFDVNKKLEKISVLRQEIEILNKDNEDLYNRINNQLFYSYNEILIAGRTLKNDYLHLRGCILLRMDLELKEPNNLLQLSINEIEDTFKFYIKNEYILINFNDQEKLEIKDLLSIPDLTIPYFKELKEILNK